MKRRNNFLQKYGKTKEFFYDLFGKTFAFAALMFASILLRRMGMPVVDKRCHIFMEAAKNVSDYHGDKGLVRWFQLTKWDTYMRMFGPDNGYIARDFVVFEEYVMLKRQKENEGERFPDGKTSDYVEREIIKKKQDKLKVIS